MERHGTTSPLHHPPTHSPPSNQLMELPDSIGRLSPLKDLWLDQNNLTALPWNFFQLTNLVRLNMEVSYLQPIIAGMAG